MNRKEEFMTWLKEEFPGCLDTHFNWDLVENLINYAYKTHGHSKGSAKGILAQIIPEITEDELDRFLPDFSDEDLESEELPDVKMYFTFGSDPGFPYQNGYVIVHGNSNDAAIKKFRERFPDRHENIVNCAFFYTQEQWEKTGMDKTYPCLEVIK